eukprot:355323-Chlamydomonas_euryale.AAC.4
MSQCDAHAHSHILQVCAIPNIPGSIKPNYGVVTQYAMHCAAPCLVVQFKIHAMPCHATPRLGQTIPRLAMLLTGL